MATTKKNIRFNRERFEQAAGFYGKKSIVPQTAQLRVIVPFVAATGSYKFDVKKDESVKHIVEKLLKRNDLFVARAIGLALMVEADAAKGQSPLLSYPMLDGLALPTGIKGFTDAKAYAVYNGELTMKTGQSINYSRFPTAPFLHVPVTQPASIWNGTAKVSADVQPSFELENVLVELPEVLVLAGTKEQPITLEFPPCTIAAPASHTAYAVLIVDGWLLEGGANAEYAVEGNPFNGKF
jgi:hypothetical protein